MHKTKPKMSEGFNIEVGGVTIKNDAIYKIGPKKDDDAPEAYRKLGTSKLLVEGITEGAPCVFNVEQGVWDTGFYENSPCYRGIDKDKVKVLVAERVKHIKEPMEELIGEGKLTHHDTKDSFWLTFGMANLRTNGYFRTSQPKELLGLYIALLHGYVCSKEDQNHPMKRNATYTIIDKNKDISVQEDRKQKKAKALREFFTLSAKDQGKAKEVLRYIGLPYSGDEEALSAIVMDFVDNQKEGHNNAERLLKTVEKASHNLGYHEINLYTQLSDLYKQGVIKREGGEYLLRNVPLGLDLKAASMKIAKDKELKEIVKYEMLALEA